MRVQALLRRDAGVFRIRPEGPQRACERAWPPLPGRARFTSALACLSRRFAALTRRRASVADSEILPTASDRLCAANVLFFMAPSCVIRRRESLIIVTRMSFQTPAKAIYAAISAHSDA